MKILHAINNLSGGGAEKFLLDLALIQSKQHEVSVIQLNKSDFTTYDKLLVNSGVKITYFYGTGFLGTIKQFFQLMSFIRNNKFDVVHAHLFPTQYIVALVAWFYKKNKLRFVTTEHSTTNRRRSKWYLKWIEQFIYNCYDCAVCVSHEAEDTLRSHLNNDKVNIITIPNGVNVDAFNNAKPYPDFKSKFVKSTGHLLVMTGRFLYPKDQETVIKAMSMLDNDISLLLVGEGQNRVACESLVKSLGLLERVFFLGFRDDLMQIFKSCDIAIHSSDYEGLPLSIIEAMASGLPVVANRASGITHLVEGAGLLFEKKSHTQLADHVNQLIADKNFYNTVQNNCKTRAKQYDLQEASLAYMKIYQGI
jgi:glycosyltransferase involved in cell wall biosynthesis